MNAPVTPEMLSAAAGVILSLLFSYVPKLNVWFSSKTPEIKRLIMLVLMVVVGAVIGGLSCANLSTAIACTTAGWLTILQAVGSAAVANQIMYSLTPQLPAVKKAAAKAKAATAPVAEPAAKP